MKILDKYRLQKKKIFDYFYPEKRLNEEESIPVVDYTKYQLVAKRGAIGIGSLIFLLFTYQGYVSIAEASSEDEAIARKAEEEKELAEKASKEQSKRRAARVEIYSSQLIDNSSALSGITQGSMILAKTINKIVSANSATPVLLEVTEDFQDGSGDVALEAGAKIFGRLSSVEEGRIYINVGLLKIGPQSFPISGDVLSVDGSAGIAGRVKSGKAKNVAGAGVSTFIAGLGAGLIETTSGPWGTSQSGGNLKSGIFNGMSQTANQAAELYTQEMKSAVDEITINSGTHVVVLINEAGSFNERGVAGR